MKKRLAALLSVMTVVAVCCMSAAASGGDSGVAAAMTAGLETLKSDTMSLVLIALPIGLGIFAAFFGIRKGIALLRGIAGK